MKNILTIASTLVLGSALALTACGKDKKPSTTDPATTEPAKTDPAKADPNAAAAPNPDKPKDDKPAGGW
jgi:ABC-type oligopeptide transport system substrate-binding subunit